MSTHYKKIKYATMAAYSSTDYGYLLFKYEGVSDHTEVFDMLPSGRISYLFGFTPWAVGNDELDFDKALVKGLTDWQSMENINDEDLQKIKTFIELQKKIESNVLNTDEPINKT